MWEDGTFVVGGGSRRLQQDTYLYLIKKATSLVVVAWPR